MANPRNVCTIVGRVAKSGAHFLYLRSNNSDSTSGNDEPFGCLFTLLVHRNFRNKSGIYEVDPIKVKYVFKNESVQTFAKGIQPGDGLIVSGTIRVDDGKMIVYSESVSYDDQTLSRKYDNSTGESEFHNEREIESYALKDVPQKPLPF